MPAFSMYDKLLLFVFLFPMGMAYGQIETDIGDDLFVLVQTSIRDSDGNLVVYLESSKFTDLNPAVVNPFLDFEAARGYDTISIMGEDYQMIRRAQSQTFDSPEMVASTILTDSMDGKPVTIARFAHDGYRTIPSDTMESVWTFIRPV